MLSILVITGATVSCALPEKHYEVKYIDTRLLGYVQDFERAYRPLVNTETITFGTTDENTAAYVQLQSSGFYKMVVDRNHWESISEAERSALIFHELGHSECLLKHDDSIYDNGKPQTIMHSREFKVDVHNLVNYYIPELIGRCLENNKND